MGKKCSWALLPVLNGFLPLMFFPKSGHTWFPPASSLPPHGEFVKDLDSHEGCRPCHHPQHLHSQGTWCSEWWQWNQFWLPPSPKLLVTWTSAASWTWCQDEIHGRSWSNSPTPVLFSILHFQEGLENGLKLKLQIGCFFDFSILKFRHLLTPH